MLPFLAIRVTHLKIVRVLKRQIKQWGTVNDGSIDNQAKSQAILREHKISNKCLIVLARFLAFYLSSCACVYITTFCFSCGCDFIQRITDFYFLLILTNSSVSPFVYAWKFLNFLRRIPSSCWNFEDAQVADLSIPWFFKIWRPIHHPPWKN